MKERTWIFCGACGQEADHSGGCPVKRSAWEEKTRRMTDAVIEELLKRGYELEEKA
jgi:hypothetical protein